MNQNSNPTQDDHIRYYLRLIEDADTVERIDTINILLKQDYECDFVTQETASLIEDARLKRLREIESR